MLHTHTHADFQSFLSSKISCPFRTRLQSSSPIHCGSVSCNVSSSSINLPPAMKKHFPFTEGRTTGSSRERPTSAGVFRGSFHLCSHPGIALIIGVTGIAAKSVSHATSITHERQLLLQDCYCCCLTGHPGGNSVDREVLHLFRLIIQRTHQADNTRLGDTVDMQWWRREE